MRDAAREAMLFPTMRKKAAHRAIVRVKYLAGVRISSPLGQICGNRRDGLKGSFCRIGFERKKDAGPATGICGAMY